MTVRQIPKDYSVNWWKTLFAFFDHLAELVRLSVPIVVFGIAAKTGFFDGFDSLSLTLIQVIITLYGVWFIYVVIFRLRWIIFNYPPGSIFEDV